MRPLILVVTYRELIGEDIEILSPEYLFRFWSIIVVKFIPMLDIDLFSNGF
jgi:hypothetical protein